MMVCVWWVAPDFEFHLSYSIHLKERMWNVDNVDVDVDEDAGWMDEEKSLTMVRQTSAIIQFNDSEL